MVLAGCRITMTDILELGLGVVVIGVEEVITADIIQAITDIMVRTLTTLITVWDIAMVSVEAFTVGGAKSRLFI
jgi:hypothetical protein